VLCDESKLRVSVWNNAKYLYLQAVLWSDNDRALVPARDIRQRCDRSTVIFDLLHDDQFTTRDDRYYCLNRTPDQPGITYKTRVRKRVPPHYSNAFFMKASRAHGAIRYVRTPTGDIVRVDSFLIPLNEITKNPGAPHRLAYWGSSPQPMLDVNSVGFVDNAGYYPDDLPHSRFHEIKLSIDDVSFDPENVPRGRDDKQQTSNQDHEDTE